MFNATKPFKMSKKEYFVENIMFSNNLMFISKNSNDMLNGKFIKHVWIV